MNILSRTTRGVVPIVPTPFLDNGDIDAASVGTLVDYYQDSGAVGLTILGVMGEASKLSNREVEHVVNLFIDRAAGRLPVIVGASNHSLAASVELASWSRSRGAMGVMLQPIPHLQDDDAVFRFFELFTQRTEGKCPICVQDYPQANGVNISVAAWEKIAQLDSVFMLKHEPPAGLQKLSRIRTLEREGRCPRIPVLTSNNALYLPQELARGADGAMVGVAYTDTIVRVCELYFRGEVEKALDIYDALLPVIRHESQGAFGLATRKEMLRRRGALTTNIVRYPGSTLDAVDLDELTQLIERYRRRLTEIDSPSNGND